MDDIDLDALPNDLGFVLKSEQKEAVEWLLEGRDVFGALPTGFGNKQLILELFQLFVLAKNKIKKFIQCNKVKFSKVSSKEKAEEFRQIHLYSNS